MHVFQYSSPNKKMVEDTSRKDSRGMAGEWNDCKSELQKPGATACLMAP